MTLLLQYVLYVCYPAFSTTFHQDEPEYPWQPGAEIMRQLSTSTKALNVGTHVLFHHFIIISSHMALAIGDSMQFIDSVTIFFSNFSKIIHTKKLEETTTFGHQFQVGAAG